MTTRARLFAPALAALLLAGCQSPTCKKMKALCGTEPDACSEHLKSVKESSGDEGVAAVERCFAEAKTCAEATGCTTAAALKGLGKAATDFVEGLKKEMDKK